MLIDEIDSVVSCDEEGYIIESFVRLKSINIRNFFHLIWKERNLYKTKERGRKDHEKED